MLNSEYCSRCGLRQNVLILSISPCHIRHTFFLPLWIPYKTMEADWKTVKEKKVFLKKFNLHVHIRTTKRPNSDVEMDHRVQANEDRLMCTNERFCRKSPWSRNQSAAETPPGTQSTHFTHAEPGNNTLGASTFI